MDEEVKRKKDADIHVRCYPEDKAYVEERAKDGFGKQKNSQTNFVLYAVRHANDASPIDLEQADGLIKEISKNRQPLAEAHSVISNVYQELSAIGNNINQIAKSINTIMKIAREDGEDARITVDKLVVFQEKIKGSLSVLSELRDKYDGNIKQARNRINNTLRKEDELLTRCLVFPTVGTSNVSDAQLLRLLQDYMKANSKNDYNRMSVAYFKSMIQRNLTSKKEEGKEE